MRQFQPRKFALQDEDMDVTLVYSDSAQDVRDRIGKDLSAFSRYPPLLSLTIWEGDTYTELEGLHLFLWAQDTP